MHLTRHPAIQPHTPPAGGATGAVVPIGRALILCLLVVPGLLLAAPSFAQAVPQTGLLVHGSGTAYGEPDLAVLTLGVDVVAPQVQAAISQADTTMVAVRQVFLDGGVQAKDIHTAAFNVWREDIRDHNGNITGERYHVVHSYSVTVHAIGNVGSLLAAAVQAGANNIQGIQFGLSDPAALQSQARAAAMRDAEARARQLATLAGVPLGRPVSIEESTSNVGPPVPVARLQAVGATAAPVEGGQLEVRVQVTVRYALQ